MYADGHLTSAEDERVQRLLVAMGFNTDYDRGKVYDASISRVSRYSGTASTAGTHASTLAQNFSSHKQRQRVHEVLDDLVTSDSCVSPQESNFLSLVKHALEI